MSFHSQSLPVLEAVMVLSLPRPCSFVATASNYKTTRRDHCICQILTRRISSAMLVFLGPTEIGRHRLCVFLFLDISSLVFNSKHGIANLRCTHQKPQRSLRLTRQAPLARIKANFLPGRGKLSLLFCICSHRGPFSNGFGRLQTCFRRKSFLTTSSDLQVHSPQSAACSRLKGVSPNRPSVISAPAVLSGLIREETPIGNPQSSSKGVYPRLPLLISWQFIIALIQTMHSFGR